ncbi:hypothetical protein [Halosimplex pelagicum]|uniref:NrS-1 polymerase-like HBD domain-containing protein n=1 Tax=Halosimplex pelagicum TaxID=869886 RepID=A0A7D5P6M8_9EURY|nr:hypothetical protein [Halosimplex pelagicum]QLH82177.1 hypothetical protein HZS54_11420 [Halosimplex pelagicum]
MDINIDRIRDEMKNREQWLCWEAAMRDGKETKLPKDPKTGGFAQTDDPATWGSFLNANGKVKAGQMDGIGFVFTEDDTYVGVDLDNCRDPETEEWEQWALDVMQDIGGWIEISPSGTGAHVILKGEIPGDRNRKGDIEMYEDGRFFTVTGQLVDVDGERLDEDDETPEIKEAQQALDAVYDRFLAEDDESANETDIDVDPDKWGHLDLEDHDGDSRPPQSGDPNLNDLPAEVREIVETAKSANNGYRFTQLWRGNWKEYYPSHSEGDMGFCDMLAFWFSGDPERMDRVFRASGLMRPKWDDVRYSDGSTYGERTIEKAIAEVDDHYNEEYYNDLVDEENETGSHTHSNSNGDTSSENGFEASGFSTGDDEDDNDAGDGNSGPKTAGSKNRTSTTASTSSDRNSSSEERGQSDHDGEDDREQQAREQSRERGRGRSGGRKRSQKRRDGIPDDIAGSSDSGTEESTSSPRPSGSDEDEEEYYTELNFDTDSDGDRDGDDNGFGSDGMFDGDSGDDEEEEFPAEDEAASIFDDTDEESSSVPGGESDDSVLGEGDFSTSSEDSTESTSGSDSSESTSRSRTTSTTSERDDEDDDDRDKRTSRRTSGREDELEQRLDRFEKETGTELEDIQAELSKLDEELGRVKAELRHDLELEDDKLERVYWELQQYEEIVDKRENQLETMYQLLVLICHVQPEPLFDRIENILLSTGEIPPENIFDESVEDIIEHYDEDTSAMGSDLEPEPVNDSVRDRENSREQPSDPTTDSGRPTARRTRADGDREVAPEDTAADEEEDGSFLSQFF